MTLEQRSARLTILVDPRKKTVFERLCSEEDATPSQVVRRLIRRYIEQRTGRAWSARDPVLEPKKTASTTAARPAARKPRRRPRS
jgi:tRNA uridine 5-carbamoylmethylation protein Kti12